MWVFNLAWHHQHAAYWCVHMCLRWQFIHYSSRTHFLEVVTKWLPPSLAACQSLKSVKRLVILLEPNMPSPHISWIWWKVCAVMGNGTATPSWALTQRERERERETEAETQVVITFSNVTCLLCSPVQLA